MKKLSVISNQIKNNTYSYTGKGSFEAVVNKNKEIILEWLEDLLPLQKQIDMLRDLDGLEFQKRNYTRILTKICPEEYKEFVSINILVRDANVIAQYYDDEFNVTLLYDNLLKDKYLKYPGKYDKYVEYNIFQKFVMMYRDDLMKSLDNNNQTIQKTPNYKEEDIKVIDENSVFVSEDEIKAQVEKDEKFQEEEELENMQEISGVKPKDTNWTQLLLGKLK